jgi:hypothetical protein
VDDGVGVAEVGRVGFWVEDVGGAPGHRGRPRRGGGVRGDGGPVGFAGSTVVLSSSIDS